jgi:hypothetical protein
MRSILIDETPFVFLTRNDGGFELKSELARFIEKCRKKNPHREYCAYSTKNVKMRLGYGWFYNARRFTTRNQSKRKQYQKRLERRELAKTVIVKFFTSKSLGIFSRPWKLMDLHVFANENKRESLGRQLSTSEVIPLDVCQNALIAHRTGYPVFSFNEDYQYFITLPGGKEAYLQYWKPADVLKQMSV